MFVKMLTAMAGDSFSYGHNEVVEVPAKIGRAWVSAGLAEETKPVDVLEAEATKHAGLAKQAVTQLKAAQAELAALKTQFAASQDALKAASDQLAEAHAAISAHAEEIVIIEAKLAAEKEAKLSALEDLDEAKADVEALTAQLAALKASADPQGQT